MRFLVWSGGMADQDPLDVLQLVSGVAACSKSLNKAERLRCGRVAEVSLETLRCAVRRLVHDNNGGFALRSTSSDGTPITVSETIACELPSHSIIRRSGKSCHEFQVGCSCYRFTDEIGNFHSCVIPQGMILMYLCFNMYRSHISVYSALYQQNT